jgi:hypothetical protein
MEAMCSEMRKVEGRALQRRLESRAQARNAGWERLLIRLESKHVDWEIFLQIMEARLSNRANEGWDTVRIKSE